MNRFQSVKKWVLRIRVFDGTIGKILRSLMNTYGKLIAFTFDDEKEYVMGLIEQRVGAAENQRSGSSGKPSPRSRLNESKLCRISSVNGNMYC